MGGIGLSADSNVLEKPAVKEAPEDVGDPHWNDQLAPDDSRRFRALLVLSQDTADVQYAAKEACRHLAALTGAAWGNSSGWFATCSGFPGSRGRSRGTSATRTLSMRSPTPIGRDVSVLGDPRPGASSPSGDRR